MNITAIEYKSMSDDQKKDIEFVSDQESIWIDTTGENGVEAQKYTKLTDKLMKIEEDKAEMLSRKVDQESEKQKQQREAIERHEKYWKEWFKTNDIYFVTEGNGAYYRYYKPTREWITCTSAALNTEQSMQTDGAKRTAFDNVLSALGRKKLKTILSFDNKPPPSYLNLMRTDHWLKPKTGEVHELFDVLLDSVSGDDAGAREQIERMIAWNYINPASTMKNVGVLYGSGGTGKGLLVNNVLATVYGPQNVSVGIENLTGKFNGSIQFAANVLVDETVASYTDSNGLKRIFGNSTIQYDVKYGQQSEGPQDKQFWMTSNEVVGAVLLSGDNSDRRYSVIKSTVSLKDRLMMLENITDNDRAVEYLQACVDSVWTNKKEVAIWLGCLIKKYEGQGKPSYYHGPAYKELLDVQKTSFENYLDDLVAWDNFEYISRDTLHQVYMLLTNKNEPSTKYKKTTNECFAFAMNYLTAANCAVEKKRIRQYNASGKANGQVTVLIKAGVTISKAQRNDAAYLEMTHNGFPTVKGVQVNDDEHIPAHDDTKDDLINY